MQGGGGHFLLVVVAQGVDDHSAALGTELGRGAGGASPGTWPAAASPSRRVGRSGRSDTRSRPSPVQVEPVISVPRPSYGPGVGVVRDKAGTAALADMDGLAAALTGGRGGLGNIVVGQGRRDVLNVALSADAHSRRV